MSTNNAVTGSRTTSAPACSCCHTCLCLSVCLSVCYRIPYYLSYSAQYPGKFLLSYLPLSVCLSVCYRIPYYLSYSAQYPGKFMLSYLPRKSTRHEFVTVTPEGIRYRSRTFPSLASMVRWFKEHFRDPIPGQFVYSVSCICAVHPPVCLSVCDAHSVL